MNREPYPPAVRLARAEPAIWTCRRPAAV